MPNCHVVSCLVMKQVNMLFLRYTCLILQGSVYAPSFDHGVGDPIEDDIFVSLE